MTTFVRVQPEDFDFGNEVAALRAGKPEVGALAAFIGVVRDLNDGATISKLTLEHYPGMTERALTGICNDAASRWNILDALVVHRCGELRPTDQIVMVAVTSAHRGDAFEACAFIMDFLKTQAPFWKKEATPDGLRWVDAKSSDDEATERWDVHDAKISLKSSRA